MKWFDLIILTTMSISTTKIWFKTLSFILFTCYLYNNILKLKLNKKILMTLQFSINYTKNGYAATVFSHCLHNVLHCSSTAQFW